MHKVKPLIISLLFWPTVSSFVASLTFSISVGFCVQFYLNFLLFCLLRHRRCRKLEIFLSVFCSICIGISHLAHEFLVLLWGGFFDMGIGCLSFTWIVMAVCWICCKLNRKNMRIIAVCVGIVFLIFIRWSASTYAFGFSLLLCSLFTLMFCLVYEKFKFPSTWKYIYYKWLNITNMMPFKLRVLHARASPQL